MRARDLTSHSVSIAQNPSESLFTIELSPPPLSHVEPSVATHYFTFIIFINTVVINTNIQKFNNYLIWNLALREATQIDLSPGVSRMKENHPKSLWDLAKMLNVNVSN